MAKVNIFEDQWCDLVFVGRNTSFGAYVLRKDTPKRHLKALIIATVAFFLAVASPLLVNRILDRQVDEKDVVITIDNLATPEEEVEEPVEVFEEPPAEIVQATTAFPPPEFKRDDLVKEEVQIIQQDVLKETAAISTVTQAGVENPELDLPTQKIVDAGEGVPVVHEFVDEDPQFLGGQAGFAKYLSKELIYPPEALEMGLTGTVHVGFTVAADGSIRDVKILKSTDPIFNEEAIRVIKAMPRWKPGKLNGKEVYSKFQKPLVFKL